jgi:hypothetical protein
MKLVRDPEVILERNPEEKPIEGFAIVSAFLVG